MADRLVLIAPCRQAGIDIVLVCVNKRALGNNGLNYRFDRFLLNIGQHLENHLTIPLAQPEDRRLLPFARATSACSLEASAPSCATFFERRPGFPCARRRRRPRRPRPRLSGSPRVSWQRDPGEGATSSLGRRRRSEPTPWRSAGSTSSVP